MRSVGGESVSSMHQSIAQPVPPAYPGDCDQAVVTGKRRFYLHIYILLHLLHLFDHTLHEGSLKKRPLRKPRERSKTYRPLSLERSHFSIHTYMGWSQV